MSQDRIYSLPFQQVGDFEFDDAVAEVFPDMIRRSVPGYTSMLSMIGQCAGQYVRPATNVYDLGCSLGAGTLLVRQHAIADCEIYAIDSSAAMTQRLTGQIEHSYGTAPVHVVEADIRDVEVSNASFVILNLTLQFLPAEDRQPLLQSVFDGMNPGGALLLSEKICFEDEEEQQLMTDLHHEFKRAHGYSDLEIAQKRTAIENRLIPESLATHTSRLRAVGFQNVAPWFQCFTFASMLSLKGE